MDLLELFMTLDGNASCAIILNDKFVGIYDECPQEFEEHLVERIKPVALNGLNVYVKEN